ncbi:MAG: hypothetical protein P4L33_02990 [Capsulimonadaceae bacterium]|nr:hypothetical protein [Capsulimonadaceae bacterium]
MSIAINNSIGSPGLSQPTPAPQAAQPAPAQPQPAPDPVAAQHAAAASAAQLDAKLQEALQKTGIHAEIENRANGFIVLRYVDQQTHRVEFQIPTETVLSLIASLNDAAKNGERVAPGAMIDEQA